MASVLSIGGGQFMSRFVIEGLLEDGHDVTVLTRGNSPLPFEAGTVEHVRGDRTDRGTVESAAEAADPDVVYDFAAMHPSDVRTATEIFADVDAYVCISSTHAYQRTATIPLVEGTTPLEPCSEEQAADESFLTYGNRKAANDRVIFDAAESGVNAMSVRPTAVYGPYDPTQRQDYWIDRVNRFDRVLVPGDSYRMPIHLGYVEDAARAIRLVAEEGRPGEAYNVAARDHLTFDDVLGLVAEALGTTVELVHATDRELARMGLSDEDFPWCEPYPYVVSTEKLAGLGWDSTSHEEAFELTVEEHVTGDRDGSTHGPDRETEERLLETLAGGVSFVG